MRKTEFENAYQLMTERVDSLDESDQLNNLFLEKYMHIAEDDFAGKLDCIQNYIIENSGSELTIAEISDAMVVREKIHI